MARRDARQHVDLRPRAPRDADPFLQERLRNRRFNRELLQALKHVPGLAVRQPSHHEPPYRAEPISYTEQRGFDGVAGSAADPVRILFPVTWNGSASPANGIGPALKSASPVAAVTQQAFPDGQVGVIPAGIGLQVSVVRIFGDLGLALDPWTDCRYSVFINNRLVPGLQDVRPSGRVGQQWNDIAVANFYAQTMIDMDTAPLAPIHLRGGNTMVVAVDCLFNTSAPPNQLFRAALTVRGWRYPVIKEEPSIYGTLTDW